MTKKIFDLTGRVAVVTGASSGLGVQMAKALARQGADIAILARRKWKLDEVAEEIRGLGVRCLPVKCDVTDSSQIAAAVGAVKAEYGKVDILVNNAGSGGPGPAEDKSDEDWRKVIAVDLDGVFMVSRDFGRLMIANKYGRIINIASMYGLVGAPIVPSAAYHASKGGVVNLTRALAAEWAKYNITVNAICPGYFVTDFTRDKFETEEFTNHMKIHVPLGRYGKEGELDSTVVYLAADESAYVTGSILSVDGGYTCI